jgi:NTE family protein
MLLRFGGILNPPFLSEYLPGEVRLLSLIHAGNVWDNYKEFSLNDLRYGGSIALLWDTRLGAVFAGMGYTKGGDIRFFLNLGNLYLRGFEFDG